MVVVLGIIAEILLSEIHLVKLIGHTTKQTGGPPLNRRDSNRKGVRL